MSFHYYVQVNNRLLEDIHRQNADLKLKMEQVQVASKAKYQQGSPSSSVRGSTPDLLDGNRLHQHLAVATSPLQTDSGVMADDSEGDDDTDSTLSFNSTQTDRTWMGDNTKAGGDVSEVEDDDEEDVNLERSFMTSLLERRSSSSSVVDVSHNQPVSVLATPKSKRMRDRRERSSTPLSNISASSHRLVPPHMVLFGCYLPKDNLYCTIL